MKISLFGCVLLGVCSAACGSSDGGAAAAAMTASVEDTRPCGATTLSTGSFDLEYGGAKYTVLVHVPPSYEGKKRTPLVLNWHGLGSSATSQLIFSQMNPVSDEEGFLLVYPNSPDTSWDAGVCCAPGQAVPAEAPPGARRDDVGFARALVAKISADACVDSKRIYSTGMSNGGFMSHRLGCEAADLFAAVAPVAGKVGIADCKPSRPISIMDFHGTLDTIVPYATGELSGEKLTAPDTMQAWATRDGCKGDPAVTYQNGTVTCKTWAGCKNDVKVTFCSAEGEGHCWPGTANCPFGAATTDIDANRQMAAFFKAVKLP
jgi:polyhydroxybutyrate depolymerase